MVVVSLLCSSSGSAFLLPASFGSGVPQLRGLQTEQLDVQGSPDLTPQYEAGLSGGPQITSGESETLQIPSMWH